MFECFYFTEIDKDDLFYFLKITKISKEQFAEANGVNVIDDAVYKDTNPKYYSIDFYSSKNIDSSERVTNYYFYNLVDKYPNNTAEPIGYFDDNNNCITPRFYSSDSNGTYYIFFDELEFAFFKEVIIND